MYVTDQREDDWIFMSEYTKNHKQQTSLSRNVSITNLVYASDVALLANSAEKMQHMSTAVVRCASCIGLDIGTPKTKAITSLNLNGQLTGNGEAMIYTSLIPPSGGVEEIDIRIGKAWVSLSILVGTSVEPSQVVLRSTVH